MAPSAVSALMRNDIEKCKEKCIRCKEHGLGCTKRPNGRCQPCIEANEPTCSLRAPKVWAALGFYDDPGNGVLNFDNAVDVDMDEDVEESESTSSIEIITGDE